MMNEENMNKSFDSLFENDGWIITKNEKGKIKVASCEQDESNIYEKSRDWKVREVDHTKTDCFKLPQNELYKTARFFIRDLLNSEKQDKYFVCYNITYINLYICGTLVSFCDRYDKYSIIVDDGTSNIKCIIGKEDLDLNFDKENCYNTNDEISQLFKQNDKNIFLQATLMTRHSTRNLQHLVPTFNDLKLGDIVRIFGTLSEYNGNRYVFIKKIVKEPKETISHMTYLEDMLQTYSEVYKNLLTVNINY